MSLSPQQIKVCNGLARGQQDKEIASDLNRSPETVDHHIRKIFIKFGVHSRTEVAVKFLGLPLAARV